MAKSKDLSELPATITLKNTSEVEATSFRYFRVNFTEVLEPLDEVKLVATTSEEAAYYVALADADKNLSVEGVEITEITETTEETPADTPAEP